MDIRKYMQVKTTPSQVKKRRIEDDDDDIIPESPDVQIKTKKKKTNESHSKHKPKQALKEIKVTDLFGNGPIKRTEPVVKKADKVKKNTETGIHSDEEFEKSLLEIDGFDDIAAVENKDQRSDEVKPITEDHMSMKEKLKIHGQNKKEDKPTAETSSNKNKTNDKKTKHSLSTVKPKPGKKTPEKSSTKEEIKQKHSETKKRVDDIKKEIKDSNKRKFEEFYDGDDDDDINKKKKINDDLDEGSHKNTFKENSDKKAKVEVHDLTADSSMVEDEADQSVHSKKRMNKSLNNSALTDEERHERKIHSAALYQKYLNRSGPKQLGSKEMPEGAENCLKDCAFLLTGVLDSFERDDIVDTVKKYGGTIKNAISKKVTHVLAGEDAGPAKMAKAKELGIKILNEDDFLKLIRDSNKKNESSENNKTHNHDSRHYEKSSHRAKEPRKSHLIKDKSKDRSSKQEQNKSETKKSHSGNTSKNNESNVTIKSEVKKEKSDENCEIKKSKSKTDNKDHDNKMDEAIISVVKLDNSKSASESTSTSSLSSNPILDNLINNTMWVEKYKPQNLKQIIGQHGEASNVKKLINWLQNWYVNRKAKIPRPSPWAKKDDGGYYKAALLSGPPGVGKTTTVSLVCKELGFDAVELNASDTRNKTLIKEQIGELLTTTSLAAYAKGDTGKQAVTKKHVLVMDEVDGMAGNEDRGGLQELIALIKSASVPIICMCNDRNSQKMRSLVNYCYDLRFTRPRVEQIKAAMRTICSRENIKISPEVLDQLIASAGQDVRQTVHLLCVWAAEPASMNAALPGGSAAKKDVKLGPWDAVRKVFSAEDHKTMSLHDKSDLFFYDYSLAPLFVQENYLQVQPHCPKNEVLDRISKAAESIAIGDIVDKRIRSAQAWNLLPIQAMYSSVIPGHHLAGHVAGQIQFPGWLGKHSRASKMQRLCQEIHAHTRLSTTGSKSSIFLDYASHLRDAIIKPLIADKADGIERSLQVLESYHLLRDDLESLTELATWPGRQNPTVLIDPKVKAAMTRTYNKKAMALPYAPAAVKRGRRRDGDEEGEYETDQCEDDPLDSDPENDALIKKKNVKELEKKSSSSSKPSTSKGKSSKKGKGKK